jgi:hypothetical protein
VNLLERLRRWWKPAEYEDDHPLSENEREAMRGPSFGDERARASVYGHVGGGVNPDDELRRPKS